MFMHWLSKATTLQEFNGLDELTTKYILSTTNPLPVVDFAPASHRLNNNDSPQEFENDEDDASTKLQ